MILPRSERARHGREFHKRFHAASQHILIDLNDPFEMEVSLGIHHSQFIAENVMKPDMPKSQLLMLPFQLPGKIGAQPERRMTGVDAEFPDFRQRPFDFGV